VVPPRFTLAVVRKCAGVFKGSLHQDLANQKLAILEYARRKKFPINEFVEVQISSRKKPHQRGINDMLERLAAGDRLIVSELSRLGRSLGQVIHSSMNW
jgi:DNA invertase Pin-like site-specific DNA recombinase